MKKHSNRKASEEKYGENFPKLFKVINPHIWES